MSDIEIKRTPELIGAEIRTITQQARYMVLVYGMEIGRRLTEAKQLLEHGEWLPWLERETEFSPATASRYVKLYDEYGADQSSLFGTETNFATLKNLSVSNALRLIAIPAEEREEFAETNNVESLSARELDELIKQRTAELEKEARAAKEQLMQLEEGQALAVAAKEEEIDALSSQLSAARARIRELGNAPVPVAVERDEEAITAAVEKARAEAEAELEKAKRAAEAAEEQLNKAKAESKKQIEELSEIKAAQLREAENVTKLLAEEKERLRAEIAKAKTSGGSVAAFKVAFEAAQADFARLVEQYRQVQSEDPETAEKLRKAIATLIEKLSADAGLAA